MNTHDVLVAVAFFLLLTVTVALVLVWDGEGQRKLRKAKRDRKAVEQFRSQLHSIVDSADWAPETKEAVHHDLDGLDMVALGAADRIGSSGNTSPAGARRLSHMQPTQAGPLLKTIPLSLELKEFVAWAWKMARQAPQPVTVTSKPERKPWPPWLEDAKRSRAEKRRAA